MRQQTQVQTLLPANKPRRRHFLTPSRQFLLGALVGSALWLYFFVMRFVLYGDDAGPYVTLFFSFFLFLCIALVFVENPRLYTIGYGILFVIIGLPILFLAIIMLLPIFR